MRCVHLERVPVLGLDLAALQGQGGVGVVGEGGQGGLAGVQLRLPADLTTLEVEICFRILQPRPAALFSMMMEGKDYLSRVKLTIFNYRDQKGPQSCSALSKGLWLKLYVVWNWSSSRRLEPTPSLNG